MDLPQLEDLLPVRDRRVLVRCDFNVPLRDGEIVDDRRIRAALPTIEWLRHHDATVTTCSHLGRPKGTPDPTCSLEPVRRRLAELAPGVALLENLRFDPGEEADDPAFVTRLVHGHDAYVNDAFGAAHRAHASIVGPPRTLPSAAGRLLVHEVEVLSELRAHPARPFVAVLGGAKIEDKLGVIGALAQRCDQLLVGGALCFTFLAAQGRPVGASPIDAGRLEECRRLLEHHGSRIRLPHDLVVLGPDPGAATAGEGDTPRVVRDGVPDGWRGLDIGPDTAAEFAAAITSARTVFWNGPPGRYEDPRFAAGTSTIAGAIAGCVGVTVVGGGDTAAALDHFALADRVDHVSTGGGACLAFLEHGDLPGLKALRAAHARRP